MKSIFAILFLGVMLIQILSRTFMVLEYQLNQAYIAAYLCVNQNKPELHCEGHCYLQKNLEKTQQPQNKSGQQTSLLDFPLFIQALAAFPFKPAGVISFPLIFFSPSHRLPYLPPIFHPPLFA